MLCDNKTQSKGLLTSHAQTSTWPVSRGAGSGDSGQLGGCKGYPCWFACFGAGEMVNSYTFFIQYFTVDILYRVDILDILEIATLCAVEAVNRGCRFPAK